MSAEIENPESEEEEEQVSADAIQTTIPVWLMPIARLVPFLVRTCPFGKSHWIWCRMCTCGFGYIGENFHGGVLDLKYGTELQPCSQCFPEYSEYNHQWQLSKEEEYILGAWRHYRHEMLSSYSEKDSYKYEISVEMGGIKTSLLSRTQGVPTLSGARGMFTGSKRGLKDPKPN